MSFVLHKLEPLVVAEDPPKLHPPLLTDVTLNPLKVQAKSFLSPCKGLIIVKIIANNTAHILQVNISKQLF